MAIGSWVASPILGVPNVRQAAEYYRDILGFDLDPVNGIIQPTADEPGVYAIVRRAGCTLHFQIRRTALPHRERGTLERDVYFYVHGVEDLHSELQRRSARITQAPRLAPYGILELEVEDLNGYRVTFGEIEA
jgi:catechol 2,3-dioxygenase-like lactoylglutathione lyase family enzyme